MTLRAQSVIAQAAFAATRNIGQTTQPESKPKRKPLTPEQKFKANARRAEKRRAAKAADPTNQAAKASRVTKLVKRAEEMGLDARPPAVTHMESMIAGGTPPDQARQAMGSETLHDGDPSLSPETDPG